MLKSRIQVKIAWHISPLSAFVSGQAQLEGTLERLSDIMDPQGDTWRELPWIKIRLAILVGGFKHGFLVGGFKHGFIFPFHIWDVILPIDFHIFQDG